MGGRHKAGHDETCYELNLAKDSNCVFAPSRVCMCAMGKRALAESLPYRPCVGMMLFNRDGKVFVGKRVDQTLEGWQMPQGGIDDGETPREAALRELEEEVGTRNAEILREHKDWLNYDLPPRLIGVALKGKYRGQAQKWLALRFLGRDSEIDVATEHQEFSAWQWVTLDELPKLIVPFKRDTYAKVIEAFRDLG
jgi:putative (di)nucleoside polyphosphate hydrolase